MPVPPQSTTQTHHTAAGSRRLPHPRPPGTHATRDRQGLSVSGAESRRGRFHSTDAGEARWRPAGHEGEARRPLGASWAHPLALVSFDSGNLGTSVLLRYLPCEAQVLLPPGDQLHPGWPQSSLLMGHGRRHARCMYCVLPPTTSPRGVDSAACSACAVTATGPQFTAPAFGSARRAALSSR
jgi:hypothetical protein